MKISSAVVTQEMIYEGFDITYAVYTFYKHQSFVQMVINKWSIISEVLVVLLIYDTS